MELGFQGSLETAPSSGEMGRGPRGGLASGAGATWKWMGGTTLGSQLAPPQRDGSEKHQCPPGGAET